MKNLRITVRLEESERQQIEDLLREKEFRNISEVVRRALKEFLLTLKR